MSAKKSQERKYFIKRDGEALPFTLFREKRRSLKLALTPQGEVTVSVPLSCKDKEVLHFLEEREGWLDKQFEKLEDSIIFEPFSPEEEKKRRRELKAEAECFYRCCIPENWLYRPRSVQVRRQRSRWGSCSSSGTISLNVYLTALPQRLRHYVLLHELCHLKHPHHQKVFWEELEKLCPESKKLRRELKRYRLPF